MTRNELTSRFPNASPAFLKANLDADPELRPAERSEQTAALAANRQRKTQGGRCPLVRFEISRQRLLDVDAKYAAVKHLLDGIVATGIVAGDKEGQISLEVSQTKCQRGENEKTVVSVIEMEAL